MSQNPTFSEAPNFDYWKEYPTNLENEHFHLDLAELKDRLVSDANRLFVSDSDSKPQLLSLDQSTPGMTLSYISSASFADAAASGAYLIEQEHFTSAERLNLELARISPRKDLRVL